MAGKQRCEGLGNGDRDDLLNIFTDLGTLSKRQHTLNFKTGTNKMKPRGTRPGDSIAGRQRRVPGEEQGEKQRVERSHDSSTYRNESSLFILLHDCRNVGCGLSDI